MVPVEIQTAMRILELKLPTSIKPWLLRDIPAVLPGFRHALTLDDELPETNKAGARRSR